MQVHLASEKRSEVFEHMRQACAALEAATAIAAENHEEELDFELSLIDYQVQDLIKKIR